MAMTKDSSPSRRAPARQKSLDRGGAGTMRGFLNRSLLLNHHHHHHKKRNNKLTSRHAEDSQNIFGSDMVSRDFILDALKGVKQNTKIVQLEIEDFITSGHHALLPTVKALIGGAEGCSSSTTASSSSNHTRTWKSIQFVDSITASDFMWWSGLKQMVLRDFEACPSLESFMETHPQLITVQAKISFGKESSAKDMISMFSALMRDRDTTAIAFSGALSGVSKNADIPERLSQLLLETTDTTEQRVLTKEIVVHLICGWGASSATKQDCQQLCQACIRVLETGRAISTTNNSNSNNKGGATTMTRRPALMRSVTDSAVPRRVLNPCGGKDAVARIPRRPLRIGRSTSNSGVNADRPTRRPLRRPGSASCLPTTNVINSSSSSSSSNTVNSSSSSPNRGSSRGTALQRTAPARTKSLNLPTRANPHATTAAERLALMGASGSGRLSSSSSRSGRPSSSRSGGGRSSSSSSSGRMSSRNNPTSRSTSSTGKSSKSPADLTMGESSSKSKSSSRRSKSPKNSAMGSSAKSSASSRRSKDPSMCNSSSSSRHRSKSPKSKPPSRSSSSSSSSSSKLGVRRTKSESHTSLLDARHTEDDLEGMGSPDYCWEKGAYRTEPSSPSSTAA